MASYAELAGIVSQAGWSELQNKVRVAAAVKAVAILGEVSPSAAKVDWARNTLTNPVAAGDATLWYVVAANSGAALAAIIGASDAAIQSNVDAAVDAITAGGV